MSGNARSDDIESAFHPKTDIARRGWKVRSGPKADPPGGGNVQPLAEPIAANTFPRPASALDHPRPVRPHDINHFTQRSTGSLLRKAITSGSIVP